MSLTAIYLPRPLPQQNGPGKMSEEEYLKWDDELIRTEWVDGEVQVMAPVTLNHDQIFGFLRTLLAIFVQQHNLGTVHGEPYQIRDGGIRRRRSPDLFFVSNANQHRLQQMHFDGGPDLIIEVLSADSQSRDRREKYAEYQVIGVREYWLIDPIFKTCELHVLGTDGTFVPSAESDEAFQSVVLPGFFIEPSWLWRLPLPTVLDTLRLIETAAH